jgi:hypothetical protein
LLFIFYSIALNIAITIRVAIFKFNQYDGKNFWDFLFRFLISSPVSIILIGFAVFFSIFVSLLFFYHTFLISVGLTTYEHVKFYLKLKANKKIFDV